MSARLGVLALAAALLAPGAVLAQSPAELPDRDAVLLELADAILPAVQRRDTRHVVFHGCVDWHSSVHAHWALLRIARVTAEAQHAADWVERSLDLAGLAQERRLLQRKPEFERPYGRAWFLCLAREFELWARPRGRPAADRLRSMAEDVAAGLLALYQRETPSPLDETYASSAWALAQLHTWFEHTRERERQLLVEELVERHFLSGDLPQLSFADDAQRPEFFSRYGAWTYLVTQTQGSAGLERLLATRPLRALAPVELLPKSAHHRGMVWSRAWALRSASQALEDPETRAALDRAYTAHVHAGLAQHARFKSDYRAYGHWVPQFAVYALTEGEHPTFFH